MSTRAPERAGAPAAPAGERGRRSVVVPGVLLGLGLGGFVDGIVLHQILQWHHMRTGDGVGGGEPPTTVMGLEANTLADGLFHAAAWTLVVAGVFLLWSRARAGGGLGPPARLAGLVILGWGVFNVVEGVVNHQILGMHHLRDDLGGPLGWDIGFLAFGVLLIVAGAALARRPPAGAD